MGALLSGLETTLYVGNRLKVFYEFLPKLRICTAKTNFEAALLELQIKLLKFLTKAMILYRRNPILRSWNAVWGVADVDSFDVDCRAIAQREQDEADICGLDIISDMKTKLESLDGIRNSITTLFTAIQLPKLDFARGARFNSEAEAREPRCLDSTRADLLRQVAEWAESDKPGEPCIFWLQGSAGTGKSTISRTVAHFLDDAGQLGASFFFKRGESDRGNSKRLFTTIAAQLVYRFPAVMPRILQEIQNDIQISDMPLEYHFEHLIQAPLSEGIDGDSTIVLVIDALDECEDRSKIAIVLKLLERAVEVKPCRLRIFLTSRPEIETSDTLAGNSKARYRRVALDDAPSTKQDIFAYFVNEFSKLERDRIKEGPDWPGATVVDELARMAEPSFIFAATICRFVGEEDWLPEEQLQIVRSFKFTKLISTLDKTYLPVLTQLGSDEDLQEQYHTLLATLVLLADPLSARALAALINDEDMDLRIIDLRLRRLRSVLRVPDDKALPVRLFHLSFREFMVDPKKHGKTWFSVNEQEAHGKLAQKCLELMSLKGSLKSDPCGFERPGLQRSEVDTKVVDEHIPAEIQYACRFWVHHLTKKSIKHEVKDADSVLQFLHRHFLHWIEALAWIGRISEGVNMIISLRSYFEVSSTYTQDSQLIVSGPKECPNLCLSVRHLPIFAQE